MEHYARYVLRASAIIFLVDPWMVPEIMSRLSKDSRLSMIASSDLRNRAYHLLTSTIELLEEYNPLAFRSVPLAVMLSKSDILQDFHGRIVPPFSYLSDSPHPYPDLKDIKKVDTEIRTLLSETSESLLLEVTQSFSKVGFFASSATGCSTDDNGNFPRVRPSRCLDPLLWILYQLKVIPAGRII